MAVEEAHVSKGNIENTGGGSKRVEKLKKGGRNSRSSIKLLNKHSPTHTLSLSHYSPPSIHHHPFSAIFLSSHCNVRRHSHFSLASSLQIKNVELSRWISAVIGSCAMESAAVLRSFEYGVGTNSQLKSVLQRPGAITINGAAYCDLKYLSSRKRPGALLVSCAKSSEATITAKSKGDPNGTILSDNQSNGAVEKKSPRTATFPTGFEALLSEVCDETKIAELKVKLGAFEIHMKRNIDGPVIPAPVIPHATASSVPSKPAVPPPPPTKSSAEKVSPFTNVSVEKAAKLAALEASGSSGYVIVSSPTVGSFRRARTLKGKKQAPACKEGDVIKEGQVIGFLDQFGTELPVKSDVAGEVLKLLFSDGEAVGYGDPLIAVLPSFHGIK